MIGWVDQGRRRKRAIVSGLVVMVVGLSAAAALTMSRRAPGSSHPLPGRGSPRVRDGSTSPTPAPAPGSPTRGDQPRVSLLQPLSRTDDPVAYARAVASALFAVDPATVSRAQFLEFWRGQLPSVVYSDAATKGLTLAAQNADAIQNLVSGWIPTQAAWSNEAAERTQSRLAITSVTVPDYWANAVAAGQFRDPGLHMERVTGVLTQAYGAPGNRVSSSRSVVIDLGLLCGPTQTGGCRLVAPQPPVQLGDQ